MAVKCFIWGLPPHQTRIMKKLIYKMAFAGRSHCSVYVAVLYDEDNIGFMAPYGSVHILVCPRLHVYVGMSLSLRLLGAMDRGFYVPLSRRIIRPQD